MTTEKTFFMNPSLGGAFVVPTYPDLSLFNRDKSGLQGTLISSFSLFHLDKPGPVGQG